MGFFYKSKPPVPIFLVKKEGGTDQSKIIEQYSAETVKGADAGSAANAGFQWGKLILCIIILILIFFAGVYTAHDPAMKQWSDILIHAFEVLLGGTVGLLVGETASRQ